MIIKCQNCSEKFKLKEIIKIITLGPILPNFQIIECHNCHKVYSMTFFSRTVLRIIEIVPIPFMPTFIVPKLGILHKVNIVIGILITLAIILALIITWTIICGVILSFLFKYEEIEIDK